ncbi:MAG TPA: substrate-binding domain-containing protein [Candidatus Dormibacteraeota bacterium]|nr:substrate-binding domain-containing protein [Candidatus Dormibacteraeota bacterium]
MLNRASRRDGWGGWPRWLAALMGLLSLAACGGSTPSAGSGGASQANLSAVRAEINRYAGLPTFTAPGPSIDRARVAGKTVFYIPDSSANPFAANIGNAMAQAAKMLDMNFVNCTTQGQVAQWVQCYGEALNRHVNLIYDFGGVDPRVVGPQIAQAQQASIPVLAIHVYAASQTPVAVNYSVPAPYDEAARLMADWVVLDTRGRADVLVVTSNEVTGTPPLVNGIKRVFAQRCSSSCKATFVNVPVADWSTKIQTEVQSALNRDPNINYIIPIYDSMSQFIVPAVTATGRTGKVHISTYNGTPFVLGYMQTGEIVTMDVGENLDWLGWAYIDAGARVLSSTNLPRTIDEHTALRIFTRANVNDAGNPPRLSTGYGDAYVSGYKHLWGVS